MRKQKLFILPLTIFVAMMPALSEAKTKQATSNSHKHKATRNHGSHYLIPSHDHSYDRHNNRSPKWHPTIHEHRHVHD